MINPFVLANIGISTLRHKFFKARTPLVLSISITSRCNLRCTYCYSQHDNATAKDVPKEELFSTIDAFYKLGTRVLMLQGGEPLLHKDIGSIIDYVKSKGMYCSITTNSVNFEKHLPALRKLDQVQLSIDGNKEITDKNRSEGVYDSVVKAARLCHENAIPFHLHVVITNDSTIENTIVPLTVLANQYETYLNFCFPTSTGAASDKELATTAHLNKFYNTIYRMKQDGLLPTNNSNRGLLDVIKWTETHPYDSHIPSSDEQQTQAYDCCIMGDLVAWLDSSGWLHPCAIKYGQPGFSYSIKEHGPKGAWERLKNLPCHYCANSCEFNNLFNFRLESVINSVKFIRNKR